MSTNGSSTWSWTWYKWCSLYSRSSRQICHTHASQKNAFRFRTKNARVGTLWCICCELNLAWWYVHVSDLPSSFLRACIRSSVSVIEFIHALHSFMRRIHPCALFIHALYSLMRLIHPRASLIHALYSLMRYLALILLFSCISYVASYPLDQFSPPSCITYTASYLLACIFSLLCIKANV